MRMLTKNKTPYFALLIGTVFLILYRPFLRILLTVDHDALFLVGYIRKTNEFTSWPNGFYVASILTGGMNSFLNTLGLTNNHFLLAYKLVVLTSFIGIILLTWLLIQETTQNLVISLSVIAVMGILPGFVNLLSQFEDNLVSSFFHVLYLYFFFIFVKTNREHTKNTNSLKNISIKIGLILSFVAAIMAHHQNAVVLVTPMFLFFLTPALDKKSRLMTIASTYLISGTVFSGIYIYLTYAWYNKISINIWFKQILDWFIPNSFYRNYYFFNEFGWDLKRQALEISKGLQKIFFYTSTNIQFVYLLYLVLFVVFIASLFKANFSNENKWKQQVFWLFLLIHIPHSLIYESENLERWDIIIPMIAILSGLYIQAFITSVKNIRFEKFQGIINAGLIIMCLSLIRYNFVGYQETVSNSNETQNKPWATELTKKLYVNIEKSSIAPNDANKNILLLNKMEFEHYFIVAQTYYNYEDSIFALYPDSKIFVSTGHYLTPKEIGAEQFEQDIQHANLVMNNNEKILLDSLLENQPDQ